MKTGRAKGDPVGKERWAQIEDLLDQALDLAEADRVAFVTKASEGDPELKAEVLDLLRACADAADLLGEPPPLVAREVLENPPQPKDELEAGAEVGSYCVVRLLGRGGMGAVYLAKRADGFYEKQVALKVIKRAGASEEALLRFEAERGILARLEHPGIVSILDGGLTPDAMPFVVMELVLGDPIDLYCDRLKLPLRRRLELFRAVCDAVQYAHRNLVVHRDLKPSNVLVTPEGEVRLLDFGIATVLEDASSTDPNKLEASPRLTPEYAAPEQVLGKPTTVATDVYALGVVLYELLTGERPYEVSERSLLGIEEVVCRTVPTTPSLSVSASATIGEPTRGADLRATTPRALSAALRGDLDAIILKALEKDPDQRYGSVTELSEDLRRHVEGRPVRARPATRWYRTSKFVRRYRGQVAAVVTAISVLGAGVITTTALWRTTERERGLREQEAQRAGLAESMLLSTFAELGEGNRGSVPIPPAEFVAVARSNLNRLTASPRLGAGLRSKLGSISLNLSEFGAADTLFVEALAALEGMEGAELERAEAMTGLGYRSLRGSQRGDSALVWFRKALEERREILPPGDTSITNSMIDLGFSLYVVDSTTQALALLREALERPGPPLQRATGLEFLTNTLMSHAGVLSDRGLIQEAADTLARAEATALEALDLLRRSGASKRMQYGDVLISLSAVRAGTGNGHAAEEDAVQALRNYEEILGPVSQRTASAWGWIGEARRVSGDLAGAEEALLRSIELYTATAPTSLPRAWLVLGGVLSEMGEFERAEEYLNQVLEARPTRPEEEILLALERLTKVYRSWGRDADADEAERRRESMLATPAVP